VNNMPPGDFHQRVQAFISPVADETFGSVVHPGAVWQTDLFDVASIHEAARETYGRLLRRAGDGGAVHGKIFLVRGTAGSGKTHLMRAFRHAAHDMGGYVGYFQMVSRSDDYTRYALAYLIDSLDKPYREQAGTGLARLAREVFDAINAPDADKEALATADAESDAARLVNRLADAAVGGKFDANDIDIVRALLYLFAPGPRLKSCVMKWLRCEDMTPDDRALIGGMPNYPAEGGPLRMIAGLGRVAAAANAAPLVLLVDQLEETYDKHKAGDEAGQRFRDAIDALVNVAAHVPTCVVVVACLDDLYDGLKKLLPGPKRDRLEGETPPVTLRASVDAAGAEAVVARRLEHVFSECQVDSGDDPLTPFRREDFKHLAGQTIRNVLLWVHEHHRRCRDAGGWVTPPAGTVPPPPPPPPIRDLEQLWNDFKAKPQSLGVGDEPALAELLAYAVRTVSAEFPPGVDFSADLDTRFVTASVAGDGGKRFVAVCDKGTQGGGLGKQVQESVKKANGLPVVFARSTDFPKTAAQVAKDIAKLVKPAGTGMKVVVSDSDWRAMAAFKAFHAQHHTHPGFAAWQRDNKPLSGLPALRAILDLDAVAVAVPPPPMVPPPVVEPAKSPPAPKPVAVGKPRETPTTDGVARLGVSRGAIPAPVDVPFADLCRHAAFLGGSGSGKTTAALAVLEQLLVAGVPAVMIDRKGDLARYADPDAWAVPEPDPGRAERRRLLHDRLDIALYTPGSSAGRPIAIPVVPDLAGLPRAAQEELAGYAAAGLAGMMGYKEKPGDPKLVILRKAVEVAGRAASVGQPITPRGLQQLVAQMDESLLAETDGFDGKHFKKLGEDLLTLVVGQQRLLEDGEPLDVDDLLGRGLLPGKTRLAVISTQWLGSAADFWVGQFFAAFDRWRAKSPSKTLQAVLLLDEATHYLPAGASKPAAKAPLESLLRQGRSAGLGVFLSTQSPGDLDYKGRDQVLTWLIGRVKEPTALNKLKPMLERQPAAIDKLAGQAAGEFYLVRESGVSQLKAEMNLLPTEQLPADRILALAKAQAVAAGEG
jgi:hypothetical protein